MFATIVKELTGDWVTEISCSEIQGQNRWYYDEVIFFGDADDLKTDGVADLMNAVSMADRFNFDESRMGYYYNTDPKCREERSLEADKKYIVIYNGENSVPYILEFGKDHIDLQRLFYEVTIGAVKGTPRWGQRAHSAVFDFFSNALIYMIPEAISPEDM